MPLPVPTLTTKWGMMLLIVCSSYFGQAQDSLRLSFFEPSDRFRPDRARMVMIGTGTAYAGGMGLLYGAWYRDYAQSGFHFFDDREEWLMMDKVGHAGSAYTLSRWAGEMVAWSGVDRKRAALAGAGMGMLFLSTVEVFDGFSDAWGFSVTDMIANTAGAGLYLGQELGWGEQRIQFKFSYSRDPLAQVRPDVFGSSLAENVLKDYNGQTYWLSFNLKSLGVHQGIPDWLNLAVGYGAGGMLTAVSGESFDGGNDPGGRYRQFYLSPDIDWTRIPVRKPWQKTVLMILGCIKLPAPAMEWRSDGRLVWHGLQF